MIERTISLKGAAILSVYTCKHLMYSIPEECVQVMVGTSQVSQAMTRFSM